MHSKFGVFLRCRRFFAVMAGAVSIWLWVGVHHIRAADFFENGFVARAWDAGRGLPQNTVNAMIRSRDGYLWLGTENGLASFDGVRFRVFGVQDGLPSSAIRALLEDHQGALWVGTLGGASCWQSGWMRSFTEKDGLAGNVINALAEDSEGSVWIGTDRGLSRWRAGRIESFGPASGLPDKSIYTLHVDRHGHLLVAVWSEGVYEYRDGKFTELPLDFPNKKRKIARCVFDDARGRLWVSAGNGVLMCREPGGEKRYTAKDGVPFAHITCMAETSAGLLCAGTFNQGLYMFLDGRFVRLQQPGMRFDDAICSLLPDDDGNLWVGTRASGLIHLMAKQLTTVAAAQGLTNEYTRSVAEAPDGTLWIASSGNAAYGLTGNRITATLVDRIPNSGGLFTFTESVLARRDGWLWAGAAEMIGAFNARGESLTFRGEDRTETIKQAANSPWLRHDNVQAMCEGANEDLWVGTRMGQLRVLHNGNFREPAAYTNSAAIVALTRGPEGTIWVGTSGAGLLCVADGPVPRLTAAPQLPSQFVLALHIDRAGTLWVGTAGSGLIGWQNGRFTDFNIREGLPDNTISQILEDDAGNLWLGGNRGIFRLRRRELEDWMEGKTKLLHPRVFGEEAGMLAEECSQGSSPNCFKSRNGLLYFTTVRGVVIIDPKRYLAADPLPEALIEDMQVNGQMFFGGKPTEEISCRDNPESVKLNDGGRLTVPAGRRDLQFDFTGLTPSAPESVRFRYRLAGLEPQWTEAGLRRTAYYSHLPPGRYRFEVMACNRDGLWNEAAAGLNLHLQPYFYETRWFQAAGLGLLALALALVVRAVSHRRLRRRLELIELQSAVEKERSRIARDIHDDFGSSLTQIALMCDLGKNLHSEAGGHFNKVADKARAVVRTLDEIVWAVNPKNDNLVRTVGYITRFGFECFQSSPIRCCQQVPSGLPKWTVHAEVRHNLFLVVKEALNNVLKHSQAAEVWLRLTLDGQAVCLEIEDNGRGFEPAETDEHRSGLRNMRTRIEGIGGTMSLVSRPGQGTKVSFKIVIPPVLAPAGDDGFSS